MAAKKKLPKVNTGNAATPVDAINTTNEKLDILIKSVSTMSYRVFNSLKGINTLLSDFIESSPLDTKSEHFQDAALYGINVKLASIAMMLGEYFEDVRRRWEKQDLLDKPQNSQPKPPKDPGNKPGGRNLLSGVDADGIVGWTAKWLAAILTGLGLAIAASGSDIVNEAIKQSGITLFLSKWIGKILYSVSGIGKLFEAIANNPVMGTIIKTGATVIKWVNAAAEMLVPFYDLFIAIGKRLGRLVPFVAAITTALDFLRGFEKGKDMLEGVKFGIAEVAAGWVGWPLKILKDIVSWAAGKLGFENFSKMLDDFDIIGTVKNLAMSMFDVIVKTFTIDPSKMTLGDWTNKILDIVSMPINIAINALKTIFGVEPKSDFNFREWMTSLFATVTDWMKSFFTKENFAAMYETVKKSVTDTFSYVVDTTLNAIKDILSKITDYLPSIEDIKRRLASFLPDWMTGDEKALDTQLADIDKKISEQTDALARSRAGEKVFAGWLTDEAAGQTKATIQLQEAKQLREDIVRAIAKRDKGAGAGNTNVSIISQGGNTYATNNNQTNISGTPSSVRPDR